MELKVESNKQHYKAFLSEQGATVQIGYTATLTEEELCFALRLISWMRQIKKDEDKRKTQPEEKPIF